MQSPYGVASDQHFHNWTAFAQPNEDGVNSRLQKSLDELRRLADEVKAAGGNTIINGGDTFHTRGSLAPSVLNPVLDLHRKLIEEGFQIVVLAGNHDLENRESERLGSAVTALEGIGCTVVSQLTFLTSHRIALIPWIQNVADLKVAITECVAKIKLSTSAGDVSEWELFIHAPIDGIIPGLPSHGLNDAWLAAQGFKRVFSGHYHSHKDFGNGVYSIGATSHQTWSDINSKAGFLVVSDSNVKWFKSHAPEFIEIDGDTDPADIPLIAPGNYIRAKINSSKQSDIEALREYLAENGAAGSVILSQKVASEATREETAETIKAGASIEVSVDGFVTSSIFNNKAELALMCQGILSEARMEEIV